MKKKLLLFIFSMLCIYVCTAQNVSNDKSLEEQFMHLQQAQVQVEAQVRAQGRETKALRNQVHSLATENVVLRGIADSLRKECDILRSQQSSDKSELSAQIDETNSVTLSTQSTVANRSLLGGVIVVILVVLLLIVACYLLRRLRSGSNTIDEVRKAQEALQSAQVKLQEDSLSLDNKMVALMEQQVLSLPKPTETSTSESVDHSLVLKVADEMVLIETNLSRMDSSIKGHKQLSKAVGRIRDNFLANGYEIVDMLGKPYNEGMRVVANFVPDENLKEGEQIITGITKPQVNYKGKMIQSAQITVSQNI